MATSPPRPPSLGFNYVDPLAPKKPSGGGLPPMPSFGSFFGMQSGPGQVGVLPGASGGEVPTFGTGGVQIGGPPAGGGGAAPATPPAQQTTPTPGLTNTAAMNPDLSWLSSQFKQRFSQDPTQRAMDKSTSQIRDAASGLMKEATTDAARRGVLGQGDSGILGQAKTQISDAALRAAAKSSSDIALGREGELDRLLSAGPAVLGAAPQLALQQQNLGLNQQQINQQGQLAQLSAAQQQQQLAMQQQQMMANLWGSYMGMLR